MVDSRIILPLFKSKKRREEEIKRKEREAAEYARKQELRLMQDIDMNKKSKAPKNGPIINKTNQVSPSILYFRIFATVVN